MYLNGWEISKWWQIATWWSWPVWSRRVKDSNQIIKLPLVIKVPQIERVKHYTIFFLLNNKGRSLQHERKDFLQQSPSTILSFFPNHFYWSSFILHIIFASFWAAGIQSYQDISHVQHISANCYTDILSTLSSSRRLPRIIDDSKNQKKKKNSHTTCTHVHNSSNSVRTV